MLKENNMAWKFTDEEGLMCCAEYDSLMDVFTVWKIGNERSLYCYVPEEVEDYLNRGIWKRLS